jgi:hypothetical protein
MADCGNLRLPDAEQIIRGNDLRCLLTVSETVVTAQGCGNFA